MSSVEAGFNVYASPVIFSDDSGNQYVIALWVNNSSAKLVKYDYQNRVLTKDTDFESVTFNTNATGFKAHQISLLVSDSDVNVYVGHGSGISKINALTGEEISSSDVRGAHYSMLVYNDKVYATTSTQIVEYNSSLSSAIARSLSTDEIPSIGFPLVVSGEFIYAAKPNTIFKIDLPSDGIGSSITSFTVDNTLSTDVETLTNIVAYNNDGIIYSSTYSLNSFSYNFTTTIHGFFGSTTHNDGEADFEFYSENRRANSNLEPYDTEGNRPKSALGDASYTMLASSGTSVYLSGYYIFNEVFNHKGTQIDYGVTPNAGIVSFTPEIVSLPNEEQVDEKATSFFALDAELVKDYSYLTGAGLSNKVYFFNTIFYS